MKIYVIKRQSGLSLVEIMLSLVLGIFLTGGMLQLFTNSNQSYRLQESISRLQENGSFAMEFMTRDIRALGYKKCSAFLFTALAGTNNDGLNSSDTIAASKSVDACAAPVANTAISTITYSIQAGTNGQPSLFENNEELVEGIESLQIIYGEDNDADGSPNYYVPANLVVDMNKVVSVRISLVAVTLDDNVASQANNVFIFGAAYVPPAVDRKIRRVYTSTIAIRNRLRDDITATP